MMNLAPVSIRLPQRCHPISYWSDQVAAVTARYGGNSGRYPAAPRWPVTRSPVQRLHRVGVESRRVAAISSSSCATEVALAIGAVTPGRAMSQASATCAGVAPSAVGDGVERGEDPQAARIHDTSSCPSPRALLPKSASRAVLAGQESRGEREVRDDADALAHAQRLRARPRSSRGRTGCTAAAASRSAAGHARAHAASACASRCAVRFDAPIALTLPCAIS